MRELGRGGGVRSLHGVSNDEGQTQRLPPPLAPSPLPIDQFF